MFAGPGTFGTGREPDAASDGPEHADDRNGDAGADQDAVSALRLLALLALQAGEFARVVAALILRETFFRHDANLIVRDSLESLRVGAAGG